MPQTWRSYPESQQEPLHKDVKKESALFIFKGSFRRQSKLLFEKASKFFLTHTGAFEQSSQAPGTPPTPSPSLGGVFFLFRRPDGEVHRSLFLSKHSPHPTCRAASQDRMFFHLGYNQELLGC